jgi:hypothetical protein
VRTDRLAALLLAACALAGCGGPAILVDAQRADADLSLTVVPCPAGITALRCAADYSGDTVLPAMNAAALHRTLGIDVLDGTTPVRLQLQQGGGARGNPAPQCRMVDVTVGGATVTVSVTVGTPLAWSCAPAERCTDAGPCVGP